MKRENIILVIPFAVLMLLILYARVSAAPLLQVTVTPSPSVTPVPETATNTPIPVSGDCPVGLPANWLTLTPSYLWLDTCASCLYALTPTLSPTPASVCVTPTGTPALTPVMVCSTVTPTVTFTPTPSGGDVEYSHYSGSDYWTNGACGPAYINSATDDDGVYQGAGHYRFEFHHAWDDQSDCSEPVAFMSFSFLGLPAGTDIYFRIERFGHATWVREESPVYGWLDTEGLPAEGSVLDVSGDRTVIFSESFSGQYTGDVQTIVYVSLDNPDLYTPTPSGSTPTPAVTVTPSVNYCSVVNGDNQTSDFGFDLFPPQGGLYCGGWGETGVGDYTLPGFDLCFQPTGFGVVKLFGMAFELGTLCVVVAGAWVWRTLRTI